MDLICLPLSELDVILGMIWLESNHVYINCDDKTLLSMTLKEEELVNYVITKELKILLKDEAKDFAMISSLFVEGKTSISEFLVVCEFPKVFPDDIFELPLEREVEFSIDLIPGMRPISMAPYQMSASELSELKSQLG